MTKYVIANRLANSRERSESGRRAVTSLLSSLAHASTEVVALPSQERSIAIIDVELEDIRNTLASNDPDLIIEPLIAHWPSNVLPADLRSSLALNIATSSGIALKTLQIRVEGDGGALPSCPVRLFLRQLGILKHINQVTDRYGDCNFDIPDDCDVAAAVAMPRHGFWPVIVRGLSVKSTIDCPPLPPIRPHAWWHEDVGVTTTSPATRGSRVKVGVIDTGCSDHDALSNVFPIGSVLNSVRDTTPQSTQDVDSHGTHVAGIIGAASNGSTPEGIAPDCEIYAIRVFERPGSCAFNADIAAAIDILSTECQVDLINLSLGSDIASDLIRDAIVAARDRGTLCICAAGNSGGAVEFPAAFPEAVAVAALGKAGWAPAGSLSETAVPSKADRFGRSNLFAASFSAAGNDIACAAPGVGIISTMPDGGGRSSFYGVLDGTSMASPLACGVLAVLMSRSPTFLSFPNDASRAQAARNILNSSSRDVGLPTPYQGRGVPVI